MKYGVENLEIGSDRLEASNITTHLCTLCTLDLISDDETHWIKVSDERIWYYHSYCFYHVAFALQKFLRECGVTVMQGEKDATVN